MHQPWHRSQLKESYFSGKQLPYSPLKSMTDLSVFLLVGKLPRDALLERFMEQLSIFLNTGYFNFNGFQRF